MFQPTQGVTQGDVVSPTIFNIVIDAICRHAAQVVKHIRTVQPDPTCTNTCIFYADDGFIGGESQTIVQQLIDVMALDFKTLGLSLNVLKTKSMTTISDRKGEKRGNTAYWRTYGQDRIYSQAKWQNEQVKCPLCPRTVQRKRKQQHLQIKHGIYEDQALVEIRQI